MPTTTTKDGFSAEERAAMKQRAAELKAQGKAGLKREEGLQAIRDAIAAMQPDEAVLAQHVHDTVTAVAPELMPKTWYGFPSYATAEGKVVVFFQPASKFKYRYSTLGFQEDANLDDGEIWPVAYALTAWNAAVEKRVSELVRQAASR